MEKIDRTELVCIIDKSGSMWGYESDTLGGLNGMIKKQKEEKGECCLTTLFFDTDVKTIHDHVDIRKVAPLPKDCYEPGGCTALLDAIGLGIKKIRDIQKSLTSENRADHIIFFITTDGLENASHEYSYRQIKKMITSLQKEGWTFLFSAANIDAGEEADHLGIDRKFVTEHENSPESIGACFEMNCEVVSALRGKR